MPKTFVISDTHFNHTNIIEYEQRPFESIPDMNAIMISRWNSVVTDEDTVFHLGDFCLGNYPDRPKEIMHKLKGKKILVCGNHDKSFTVTKWKRLGFDTVYKYPIGIALSVDDINLLLSHRPIYIDDVQKTFAFNIHGHIHSGKYNHVDVPEWVKTHPTFYYNVSTEALGYVPIDINEIIKHFKEIHQ